MSHLNKSNNNNNNAKRSGGVGGKTKNDKIRQDFVHAREENDNDDNHDEIPISSRMVVPRSTTGNRRGGTTAPTTSKGGKLTLAMAPSQYRLDATETNHHHNNTLLKNSNGTFRQPTTRHASSEAPTTRKGGRVTLSMAPSQYRIDTTTTTDSDDNNNDGRLQSRNGNQQRPRSTATETTTTTTRTRKGARVSLAMAPSQYRIDTTDDDHNDGRLQSRNEQQPRSNATETTTTTTTTRKGARVTLAMAPSQYLIDTNNSDDDDDGDYHPRPRPASLSSYSSHPRRHEDDGEEPPSGSLGPPNSAVSEDSPTTRVTRKGQRLELAMAPSRYNVRASTTTTTTRVPGAFANPGRHDSQAAYEQIAINRRLQQEQRRQQSQGMLLPHNNNQQQHESPSPSSSMAPPNLAQSPSIVVHGRLVVPDQYDDNDDNDPEEQKTEQEKPKRRRLCIIGTAVACIVVLVLAIVVPLQLLNGSSSSSSDEPVVSPTNTPAPVVPRTPAPVETLSPSLAPRGAPFVELGPEIAGEDTGALLGFSVAAVGDQWFAHGSPGFANRAGLVRVMDTNGNQIGQDLVGNTTEGFNQVGWFLTSFTTTTTMGGREWLAVAGRNSVRLFGYNHTLGLWERYGRILHGPDIEGSFFLSTWFISSVNIGPLSLDYGNNNNNNNNNNMLALVVTSFALRSDPLDSYINTFWIQVDDAAVAPEWQRLAEPLVVLSVETFSSIAAGPSLIVSSLRERTIDLYRLQSMRWVPPLEPTLVVDGPLERLNYFHNNNNNKGTTTTTVVYFANNVISVVEIDASNNNNRMVAKGLGIAATDVGFLTIWNDWIVYATNEDDAVRVFWYDSETERWTRQGNDIVVNRGSNSIRVVLGGTPLSSPHVLVGLPGQKVSRLETVYLNSTNLTSFDDNDDNTTTTTNLFTNATGHVFANQTVDGLSGVVQLYHRPT